MDSRWSPLPDQEFEGEVDGEGGGDLEEMMRNLDIADHIPALKVCVYDLINRSFVNKLATPCLY